MTQNCTEKDLENNLGIYGEIEKIVYFNKLPPFAFVKFKKVDYAIKAFDNQKTLVLLLSCPNLKIMFSDHEKVNLNNFFNLKRLDIVGDLLGYEKDEELSTIVYCGLNFNIQL